MKQLDMKSISRQKGLGKEATTMTKIEIDNGYFTDKKLPLVRKYGKYYLKGDYLIVADTTEDGTIRISLAWLKRAMKNLKIKEKS